MKIVVDRDLLLKNISKVIPIAVKAKTLNILEYLLIEVEDTVVLTSNDMNVQIQTEFNTEIIEKGSCLVKAKLFSEIIKKMPSNNEIVLEKKNNEIFIHCGKIEFKLPTLDPQDFPKMERKQTENRISINKDEFIKSIDMVVFSASKEDIRPTLKGVLFEKKDDKLFFVALDGHRLSVKNVDYTSIDGEISKIIPAETLDDVTKIAQLEDVEEINISFFENQAYFIIGSTNVICSLIAGKFFDYRNAIPNEHSTKVIINSEILNSSIERATIVTREDKLDAPLVIFDINENSFVVQSISSTGKYDEELLCNVDGKHQRIGFNAKYFLEVFKVIKGDIEIKFVNQTSPCILRLIDDDKFIYVVLPLRMPE
ncbi:DNA polymerase III subunit beta [Caldicellulosiruptoraceae bacterium PP1]